MLKGFFFSLFVSVIGVVAIYRGKMAIKNKFMSNSRKSARYTGVTQFEGQSAVKVGKMNVVLGWIFVMAGILGACCCAVIGTIGYFMSGETQTSSTSGSSWSRSSDDPNSAEEMAKHKDRARKRPRGGNSGRAGSRPNSRPGQDNDEGEDRWREGLEEAADEFQENVDDVMGDDLDDVMDDLEDVVKDVGEVDSAKEFMDRARDAIDRSKKGRSRSGRPKSRAGSRNSNGGARGGTKGTAGSGFGGRARNRGRNNGEAFSGEDRPAPEIGSPAVAFPKLTYDVNRVEKSELVGFTFNDRVSNDDLDPNSVLVGFDVGYSGDRSGEVTFVQPIYQREGEYVFGQVIGQDGGEKTTLLAPAGFAVSGINVVSGVDISAFRVSYMKMGTRGRLDRKTEIESDWIGASRRKSGDVVNGRGDPMVGVFGGINGGRLVSLGLVAVKRLEVDDPLSREWKTADGGYTVEAKYVEHSEGKVKLLKPNGKTITVAINILSAADQKWLADQ